MVGRFRHTYLNLCVQREGKYENANDQYCNNLALKYVGFCGANPCYLSLPVYVQDQYEMWRDKLIRALESRLYVDQRIHDSRSVSLNFVEMCDTCNGELSGCDVTHPSPGVTNRPSVASVVSSIDAEATRYSALLSVQEPRTEIITEIKSMIQVCSSLSCVKLCVRY